MTVWDRSVIILLGVAGFAFSYDALRQIALAIHARETLSYLFPVFIDGFIAYGVRAIVHLRHERFAARLYAWFLFLAATGASLGANALHAVTVNGSPHAEQSTLHLTDNIVGALSMLAPLALAGSVHLYILMARTAERAVPDRSDAVPGPVREQALPPQRGTAEPGPRPQRAPAPMPTKPSQSGPSDPRGFATAAWAADPAARPSAVAHVEGAGDRGADGPDAGSGDQAPATAAPGDAESTGSAAVRAPADGEESTVPDNAECPQPRDSVDDWLEELLPIARGATRQAGRTSREVVAGAVRKHQAISNDRLGVLLARLKEEDNELLQP
ncbi:DUF2637 domain-containing protein [Streptomyces lonarensis]|uniref:DUF2637 domain-containing protein n=1 Tax=Streptomyces lonarensis TaxID=700599 RepID=A0A7X6HXC9_9ACTN|nr:DUF2637 domain-containing protein [Streptomyces lonarensis]NJQ04049.1 DUF2637 domain-containing protein [Streptomyces lonarensis]